MAVACICLLPAHSLRAAEAGTQQRFDFFLPTEPLEAALERFNAQCGVSTGFSGALPAIRSRAVAGRYTAFEALQRMLAGSGIEAVATDAASFRLQRVVIAPPPSDAALPAELPELLVTANKRSQQLLDVPMPITVVSAAQLATVGPLADTGAALDFDATTSSTHLGPGRDRLFIRGVADSAFLGPSQATVSVQFDESRLNYSAPDPDLRLLDVERVEILKGPQGPLYGTGALGGVMHVLPRAPDPSAQTLQLAAFGGATAQGGPSRGSSAVLNLPLLHDSLALRAVAYVEDSGGWIDNAGARRNANGAHLAGGRLALRVAPAAGWTLDLQGAVQYEDTRDSQYVLGDTTTLARSGVLPEPRDNDFALAAAVLHGSLWGGELVFSSSYVRQEVDGTQDASASAALFAASPPLRYEDQRTYRLFGNELRFSSAAHARLSWLVGVAQLATDNDISGRLDPAPAAGASVLELRQQVNDLALFGELALTLPASLRLSSGLRYARVLDEDERGHSAVAPSSESPSPVVHAATPSVTLDWRSPQRRTLAYLRFARALRPGGLNPDSGPGVTQRFRSDELSSLDAGLRMSMADEAITLQAAAFATRWQHVQSDYLQADGLIGTHNVGDASNLGAELQLQLHAGDGWGAELGGVLQRARLEHTAIAVMGDDPRLPVVPDARFHAALSRELSLGDWRAHLQLRADYIGASRLSFDADLDRDTPASFALGLDAAVVRGPWELRFDATNLLDSRADTFAFGNPFSIRDGPQRTPRRPRTLTLQLARSW